MLFASVVPLVLCLGDIEPIFGVPVLRHRCEVGKRLPARAVAAELLLCLSTRAQVSASEFQLLMDEIELGAIDDARPWVCGLCAAVVITGERIGP